MKKQKTLYFNKDKESWYLINADDQILGRD